MKKRRIFQFFSFLLLHSSWGPELKWFCNPVLSCHSCALSWFACPIGVFIHYAGNHLFPFFAWDLSLREDGQVLIDNWNKDKVKLEKVKGRYERKNHQKIYEMAVKLSSKPMPGKNLFFSTVTQENDGTGEIGYLGWNKGAGEWPVHYRYFGAIALTAKSAGTILTAAEKNQIRWPKNIEWERESRLHGFNGTPEIDGDPNDDVWQKIPWTVCERWVPTKDHPQYSDSLSVTKSLKFKFLYDETCFYFLMVTTDDRHVLSDPALGTGKMHQGDCIQIQVMDVARLKKEMPPRFTIFHGDEAVKSDLFKFG